MSSERFRDRKIEFANGVIGRPIEIASANPLNYYQLVTAPGEMPPVAIDGQLFLPAKRGGNFIRSRHNRIL